MRLKKNARGFKRGEFVDGNGVSCSIQESSAAEAHFLWLGCNDPNAKIFPGDSTGWHDYPLPANVECTTRMHLTRRQVAALLPHLERFIETGRL